MLIEFTRNGKAKRMSPKLARVLEKKGHIRIVDVGVQTAVVERPSAVEQISQTLKESVLRLDPDIENMGLDELREVAAGLGIPVHHRSGEDKIRADIRAHSA